MAVATTRVRTERGYKLIRESLVCSDLLSSFLPEQWRWCSRNSLSWQLERECVVPVETLALTHGESWGAVLLRRCDDSLPSDKIADVMGQLNGTPAFRWTEFYDALCQSALLELANVRTRERNYMTEFNSLEQLEQPERSKFTTSPVALLQR